MCIELFDHNAAAYKSAVSMMENTGKAVVIHPTGTGKSFIGFKLAEEHPNSRILWLTPSEYIVKTQLENLKNAGGKELGNVTFITYAKLMQMNEEDISKLIPDVIICDEYHRAGAAKWQEGFERLIDLYPDAKLMGLSATNIRYLDNQRDMAEELFEGNIASEMTLGEAIVLGILPAPKYVISVYAYQKEMKKYEERIDHITNTGIRDRSRRELEDLRRALEMADGLDKVFKKNMTEVHGKYIAFCSNSEHMYEMISHAKEWFGDIDPDMKIYEVYSDDPEASEDFIRFKEDRSDNLRILFCIDMLNEGVHIDDIDGVILFRPTVSPIIYKQQIGRALAAGKKKTPVIFDIVNNFENLYSIGTIQEEIELAVSYYRDLGESERIVTNSFEIIDETRDSRKLFDILEKSLRSTWETYFLSAKAYFEDHGNLNVPKKYVTKDGLTLGMWIQTQRRVKRGSASGILTAAQINRLESIGMVWDDARGLRWEQGFQHAKAYYEKYGNLDVKAQYKSDDGYNLGRWIANNRTWYGNNSCSNVLTRERVKRLESIGMVWRINNAVWEMYFNAAVSYYAEHGDLDVESDYIDKNGLKLGNWLTRQRQIRKGIVKNHSALSQEQIERLDMIGMVWEDKYEKQWNKYYLEAFNYFNKYGNIDVPAAYKTDSGIMLGRWVSRQRNNKRLTDEQRNKLNRIGMRWGNSDSWESRFAIAKRYYDTHGNLDISQDHVLENVWIGKWLYEQRRKKAKLREEQIMKLNSIGMDWRSDSDRKWDKNYELAQRYYIKNGCIDIPQSYKTENGATLGMWIYRQKQNLNKNKLDTEQVRKLKDVGITLEA